MPRRIRTRRTDAMKCVRWVEKPPQDGIHVPLRIFIHASPVFSHQKARFRHVMQYLLEEGILQIEAVWRKKRALRFYNRNQAQLVERMLAMLQKRMTIRKAYHIARKQEKDAQERLF